MKVPVRFKVNEKEHEMEVDSRTTLLELLRNQLKVKSLHRGCEEGECGACTVLLDGVPVYSCLILAVQANGAEIMTVEGLVRGDELHPLMKSFLENRGVQCGYCTSGVLMTAYFLINKLGELSEEEIRKGIEGNICRCTGYMGIVKAIRAAAEGKNSGNWW